MACREAPISGSRGRPDRPQGEAIRHADCPALFRIAGQEGERLGRLEFSRDFTGEDLAVLDGQLLDRRAGTLQPLAYVRGLARAAIAAGARIHTGSAALSSERLGGRWEVKTAGGSVVADWIIVASEFYSHGPWEAVRNEQVVLPYFNVATRPLSPALLEKILPGREGCWDTREILSSFRMDRAGRLVFGSVGALRNTGRTVHHQWAKRALAKLFPDLGPIEFDAEWHGRIGMTVDAVPRFQRFAENVVGFSGYNGRGIAPGTVFGLTLARLIQGELSEQDLPLPVSEVAKAPFRNLKGAYYEAGAQIAHFAGDRF